MENPADPGAGRALLMMQALRAGILAVCLATAIAAWAMGWPTLLGLAAVIAAEETWETSVVISALRRQLRGTPYPLHRS